jgi:hypothetical protein
VNFCIVSELEYFGEYERRQYGICRRLPEKWYELVEPGADMLKMMDKIAIGSTFAEVFYLVSVYRNV